MDVTTFLILGLCVAFVVVFVLFMREKSAAKQKDFELGIQAENVTTLRQQKVKLEIRNASLKNELRQRFSEKMETGNPGDAVDDIVNARSMHENKDGR